MTRPPGGTTVERPTGASGPGDPDDAVRPGHEPIARHRGFRLSLWGGLLLLVLAGVALLAVLPTRAWLNQRRQLRESTTQLAQLQARNAKMQEQLDHIQAPDAVDEVARAKLGLVRPGEKALAVLPAPKLTLAALPKEWPYTLLQQLAVTRG